MATSNLLVPNVENIYAQSLTFPVTNSVVSTNTLSFNPGIDVKRPQWANQGSIALLSDVSGEHTSDTNPIANNIVVYADNLGNRKTADTTTIQNQPLQLGSTLGVTGVSNLSIVNCTGLNDTGNASITGTLGVTGLSTFSNANVTGTLNVNTIDIVNADVTGNAIVGGTVNVTGLSTLSGGVSTSTINASGTSTLSGVSATSISDTGTLNVTGISTLGTVHAGAVTATSISDTGTLNVTGTSTLAGVSATSISDTGTLNVTGTSTLGIVNAGAVSTTSISDTGTLGVTGTSTLGVVNSGSITNTGNVSVGGTLGVTGVSNLTGISNTGTITSSGLSSLNGGVSTTTINASGTSTLSSVSATSITDTGTLNVTGISTLGVVNAGSVSASGVTDSGTLNVTGVSTLGTVNASSITNSGTLNVTGVSTLGSVNASSLGVTGLSTLGGNLISSAVMNFNLSGGSQNASISNAGVPTLQVLYTGAADNQSDGVLLSYFAASTLKRVFNWIRNTNLTSFGASTVYGNVHTSGAVGWEIGIDSSQNGTDNFFIRCWSANSIPLLINNLGNMTVLGSVTANGVTNTGNGTVSGTLGVTGTLTAPSIIASSAGLTVSNPATFNAGASVPSSNSNGIFVFGPGTASTTLCTGVLQSYSGVAQGLCGMSFNGYFNGSDVRFNTTKNRWRLAVDQRGGTDQIQIDYLGASVGTAFWVSNTTFLVNSQFGYNIGTTSASNPGGVTTLWSDTSNNLRWGASYIGTGSIAPGSFSGSVSSTTQPSAAAISSTFTLVVANGVATLAWTGASLGSIVLSTNAIVFPIPAGVLASWYPINGNSTLSVMLQNNGSIVPGYLVVSSSPNNWSFQLASGASWTGACFLLAGHTSWVA